MTSPRRRFRVWPAGLLALVGFVGAGAVATQAAPTADPPVCVPSDTPIQQLSLSSFRDDTWLSSNGSGSGSTTPPPAQVCADLDPDDVAVVPGPANPDV